MTQDELQKTLKLSRWSVGRRNSQGNLPRPVPLPGRNNLWLRQEILDWEKAGRPSRSDWEARHDGRYPRVRALQAIMPAGSRHRPPTGPGSLDRGELSQLLRVSIRTINYANNDGRIPLPVPGPGHPRWDFSRILDWIERNCPAREHDAIDPIDRADGPPRPDVQAANIPCIGSASGVLPFPIEVFPAPLRDFATEAALSIGCPLDLVAVPMLAAAATVIGTGHVIEAKPGWREAPRVFAAVVCPPGAGKSPALAAVFRPIRALESGARAELAKAEGGQEDRNRTHEGNGYASRFRSLALPRLMDLADDPRGDPVPAPGVGTGTSSPRRVVVSDTTVEGLVPLLRQNPRGMVLLIDEISGWRASFDRYRGGRGNDRQFYLSIFTGEPVTVDRKGTGSVFLRDPFLNVFGTVQPDMLPDLADRKGRSDGFLDRFLFGFPDFMPDHHWREQGLPEETRAGWDRVVDRLAALPMVPDPNEGPDRPTVLGFTPEGKRAWVDGYEAHAAELDDPDLGEALRGAWLKLRVYALRLSLLVHLLRTACDESCGEDVDEESVRRAGLLVDYFKSHARRVHSRLTEQPADRRAELARRWIEAHGGEATARELQRRNVAGIRKASEANALLRDLVDRGFGRIESRRAGNGQRVDWFVLGSP